MRWITSLSGDQLSLEPLAIVKSPSALHGAGQSAHPPDAVRVYIEPVAVLRMRQLTPEKVGPVVVWPANLKVTGAPGATTTFCVLLGWATPPTDSIDGSFSRGAGCG